MNLVKIYKILFSLMIICNQINIVNINAMSQKETFKYAENSSDNIVLEDEGDNEWTLPMADIRILLVNNKQILAIQNNRKGHPMKVANNIIFTPLMINIFQNSEQTVNKLIKDNTDVNELAGDISPLLLAIYIRNKEIINSLLLAGADISNDLLMYAKKLSNKEISDMLENSLNRKKSIIEESLSSSLPIRDLRNICINYL